MFGDEILSITSLVLRLFCYQNLAPSIIDGVSPSIEQIQNGKLLF